MYAFLYTNNTQGSHLFTKQRGHHGSTQSSQKPVYKPCMCDNT